MNKRMDRLMPGGVPKWIRCYDNGGETCDRYTVIYTRTNDGTCHYVGMSAMPYHPQGFGQHGESETMIDRPRYSHWGKRVQFADLPEDCRKLVLSDYRGMHNLA